MRIVGAIEHPVYKITIFEMNSRYSIKIENGENEQTYKFREGQLANVQAVKNFVDDQVMSQVDQVFQKMDQLKSKRLSELMAPKDLDFPTII